jgi:hypothetical protein
MHALWCFKRHFIEIQGIGRPIQLMLYLKFLKVFEITVIIVIFKNIFYLKIY